MSYEDSLRILWSSSLEKRRMRGDLIAFNNFLRRGEVLKEVMIFSLWELITELVGMVQSCTRGVSDWTLVNFSVL